MVKLISAHSLDSVGCGYGYMSADGVVYDEAPKPTIAEIVKNRRRPAKPIPLRPVPNLLHLAEDISE